jgi:hypothetical protein
MPHSRSSGSLDGSCFLDRIERLAYQDKRTQEAARSVLAEQVHNAECTFRPEINPRSQRMVKVSRTLGTPAVAGLHVS